MPTINPTTDELGCPVCGRKFSSAREWKDHEPACAAAGTAGYDGGKVVDGHRDETADEDWIESTRPGSQFR